MDAATIRATCPNCQSTLRIPTAWAGQVVKCKKCGSGVRTIASAPEPLSLDDAEQHGHADHFVPAGGSPFEELRTAGSTARENPFEGGEHAPPAHAGYPPQGYYPYAPPPGYPYAPPPGYPPAPPMGYGPPPGYPYPMPPGYPQPMAYEPPAPPYQPPAYSPPPPPQGPSAVAVAVAAVAGFKPSEALGSHSRKGQYRRGPDNAKYIWIGVALILTAGLVFGGIYGAKLLTRKPAADQAGGTNDPKDSKPSPNPGGPGTPNTKSGPSPLANGDKFPRRLLFIHISNYLYLNPLTHSQVDGKIHGPDQTKPAANRLATEWRIPSDQIYLLSDTAPGADMRLPMREVLSGTYEKFFETSRAQDRIVVYFGGHVLTKDGKTFLVPIEGDPDDLERLVPLDEFYAKMKACKATQKVVIWDVCRYNPERGRSRPGSEPMTEETAKALAATPPGVQALLTCQPGENALEFYNAQPDGFGKGKQPVVGSNFLSATRYIGDKNRNNAKPQNPDDALPVNEWSTTIGQRVAEVVASEGKGKQTVKAVGTPPATLVAFNKEEPASPRFEYPASPKSASPLLVSAIAQELNLPGIKKDDGESGIGQFPFPAEALAPFKEDVTVEEILKNKDKYPFRVAVIDSFETIRDIWNAKDGMEAGTSIREEFKGKIDDKTKKDVLVEQLFPARGIAKLEAKILLLEAVAGLREAEPKRWQANYDYALAQCKARLAWMHEYNLALGSIRTEVLPVLDEKKGQDGYRLVATEKMKVKKEGKYADEAKELYQKIIADYKGSPWAILAKRDRTQSLGLAWQPASFGTLMPEPTP